MGRKREPRDCASSSRRPLGLAQAYVTMMTNQILGNPLEGETPTARVKLIGLMTLIGVLHSEDPTITLTRMMELTGLTRSVLAQDMHALVQRGLLIETMGNNSMGRGLARQFQLSPAVIETLGMIMGEPIRDGR
ncbi:hypothetical protein IG197_32985 (plasmid) [Aminobacter sp. SR38]|nr:hypothetical protein IG197_32430 [Aminobacter sp. SR38]QOF75379.1 hypothetical protein IG197_32985 [Aminobacter sp. SR38]